MVSYSNEVEGMTSISSTSTNLESQSLMIAFGGPDVYFTRLSPSKGFDLLPESFNKELLILVVFGLIAVTGWLSQKKKSAFTDLGWA